MPTSPGCVTCRCDEVAGVDGDDRVASLQNCIRVRLATTPLGRVFYSCLWPYGTFTVKAITRGKACGQGKPEAKLRTSSCVFAKGGLGFRVLGFRHTARKASRFRFCNCRHRAAHLASQCVCLPPRPAAHLHGACPCPTPADHGCREPRQRAAHLPHSASAVHGAAGSSGGVRRHGQVRSTVVCCKEERTEERGRDTP